MDPHHTQCNLFIRRLSACHIMGLRSRVSPMMATSAPAYWLYRKQIIKYYRVAPISIWVFDYFLTLDEEVRLVKNKGRWGITHVLYIVARFFPLIASLCGTYNALVTNLPQAKCVALYRAAGCFSFFSMLAAEGLLLIRTIALWNHNRRVCQALSVIYSIVGIVTFVCFVITDVLKFSSICEETSSSSVAASNTALSRVTLGMFWSAAFFELVVLALTILHGHMWRQSGFQTSGRVISAVTQGNLVYTSSIFLTSVANITFFALPFNDGWNGILTNFQTVLHGVVASRILFDLADAITNRIDDTTIPMSRIQFATTPSMSQGVESSR